MTNEDPQQPARQADGTPDDTGTPDTTLSTSRAIHERMDEIKPGGGHRGQEGAGGSGQDAELQSVAQSRSDRAAGSSS